MRSLPRNSDACEPAPGALLIQDVSPLRFGLSAKLGGDLRGRRELVLPVVRTGGVDDRDRPSVIAFFLFVRVEPRINTVAPDSPHDVQRRPRIAAGRDRPQYLVSVVGVDVLVDQYHEA